MKKYLVVEEAWEYNDEYFYKTEGDGFTLAEKRLFNSKEEALAKKNELNNELMKDAKEQGDDYYFVDDEGVPIKPYKIVEVEEEEPKSEDVIGEANELLDNFLKRKEELSEKIKKELTNVLSKIFEKYPMIEKISWNQYTPYFNDGDVCTFGANVSYISVNDEEDDGWCNEYYYAEEYLKNGKYKDKIGDVDLDKVRGIMEFKQILSRIPQEMYLEMFGDHVVVTVDRHGKVSVAEIDHD